MDRSKPRGQKRKYKTLLSTMDKMEPFKRRENIPVNNNLTTYEHFHVPCGHWLANPKISGKNKTSFCKKRIEKTEYFIDKKPKHLPFWDRKGPYQIWTPIESNDSFAKGRGIITELSERGYIEELNDENYSVKSQIWFYGEFTKE